MPRRIFYYFYLKFQDLKAFDLFLHVKLFDNFFRIPSPIYKRSRPNCINLDYYMY
jgi:hypothetical protein